MTDLQKSILATLAYSDIFDYPLTEEEIGKYLILDPNSNIKAQISNTNSKLIIQKYLTLLLNANAIENYDNLYCLKGRKEIISLRKEREEYSKKKLVIAEKATQKLKRIPWIKMIGLTGSLAMNNSSPKDDIDLIIITQNNRLWLVRSLILVLSPVLGIRSRKRGENQVKDKLCTNLFLDELELAIKPASLYTAHEIAQIRPILNRNLTYEKLISKNLWIKDYLPNAVRIDTPKPSLKHPHPIIKLSELLNYLIIPVNFLAFIFQHMYMKPKITNERISLHQAFFHPRPLSAEIENKFLTRLKTINKIAVGSVK